MAYFLGIDLGTSSLKGIVVNERGEVVANSRSDYNLIILKKGYSEQNPNDWLTAFEFVFQELLHKVGDLNEELVAISCAGQMHSLVLLNQKNQVLRDAILWNDGRATKECAYLMNYHRKHLMNIEKNRALEGFTLPKLLWIKEHEPDVWQQTDTFLLPKDYLNYYLTGEKVTEYSDAAGTLLLDINAKQWDKVLLDRLNIADTICPRLVNSTDIIGKLQDKLSKKYNLKQNVVVVAGGADNACAAVGAGVFTEEQGLISIGTSGVVLVGNSKPLTNKQMLVHYFNSAVQNQTYLMGVTLSAGYSLAWLKSIVDPQATFAEFTSEVDTVPVGSDGLIYTPYLFGERTPYFDVNKRGTFVGLSAYHHRNHLIRATMEGITMALKHVNESIIQVTSNVPKVVVVTGGAAKNLTWLKMIATIFQCQVTTLKIEEGPAFGAVLLAMVGLKKFLSVEQAINTLVLTNEIIEPEIESVKTYEIVYEEFLRISNQFN